MITGLNAVMNVLLAKVKYNLSLGALGIWAILGVIVLIILIVAFVFFIYPKYLKK